MTVINGAAREGKPDPDSSRTCAPIEFVTSKGSAWISSRLGTSRQAVDKWIKNGRVPSERVPEIQELAAGEAVALEGGDQVASQGHQPKKQRNKPAKPTPQPAPCNLLVPQPVAVASATEEAQPCNHDTPQPVAVEIATRRAEYARAYASACARRAGGLPPEVPVPGYPWRLIGLAVLDLPPIALAFFTVALVSPVVAGLSALALSIFLVLGAHSLGAALRKVSETVPAWMPRLIGLAVMSVFVVAAIAAILDLRGKGLDVQGLAQGAGSIFSDRPTLEMPESFKTAIVFSAGLITTGSLLFAVAWSYAHHSPQAEFARAERVLYKRLRKLERTKRRAEREIFAAVAIALLAIVSVQPGATAATATCPGRDVLALVDATTAYDDQDRNQIMPAMESMGRNLQPGDRLRVRTVRDDPATSRTLFEGCVPQPGWIAKLISDPVTLAHERQSFFKEVREAIEGVLYHVHEADHTALAATLAASVPADEVWLFSDLLETKSTSLVQLLQGQLPGPQLPSMSGVVVHGVWLIVADFDSFSSPGDHDGGPRRSNHFRQKPRKAASGSRGGSVIQSRHSRSRAWISQPGASVRAS